MSAILRPAIPADSARIAEVYLRSFHDLIPTVALAHSDDQVRTWIRHTVVPSGQVMVAEQQGEIIAMMSTEAAPECSWIHHLYVHPEYVGKGVGTELLKQAIKTLPPPIRLYTFLSNHRGRHFYERHGFTPIAYGDGSGNEEHSPDILLEWAQGRDTGSSRYPGHTGTR